MTEIITIRASEAALPACLALLPDIATPDAVVVAARDPDGTLAGAGGIAWTARGGAAMSMWIHVLPDRRRRGVGRAVLEALRALADGETEVLWSARPLADDGEAAAFAQVCGMTAGGRQMFFDAPADVFLTHMATIVERLRARGRIPEGARTIVPTPDLNDALVKLIRAELPTAPPSIDAMLRRAATQEPVTASIDLPRSRVLIVDGAVAGVLLSRRRRNGRDSTIVCNVVGAEFRRGWANALLLEATTRAGVADGAVRFAFDCAETNRDTIGLAGRGGAHHVRTDAFYRYPVSVGE